MPTFSRAADRLRRKSWKDIAEAINEVWTVFKTGTIDAASPSSFSNDADPTAPPIVTKQRPGDNWPAITIGKGDNAINLTIGDTGGLTITDGNGNTVTPNDGADGTGTNGTNGDNGQNGQNGQTGVVQVASQSLAGVIVGKVSGTTYSVKCYQADPSSNPSIGTVNMTAANLDPADEIPVGFEVVTVGFFDASSRLTGGRIYPPVFVGD